jgi:hypothetical protein
MALKQLQSASPQMYNAQAIDTIALETMGWSNPEQFFASPEQAQQPPPEAQAKMAELQVKKQDADTRQMLAQVKAGEAQAKIQHMAAGGEVEQPDQTKMAELQLRAADLSLKHRQLEDQDKRSHIEDENRDKDREANLAIERAKLIMQELREHRMHQQDLDKMGHEHQQDMEKMHHEHRHDLHQKAIDVEQSLKQKEQSEKKAQ